MKTWERPSLTCVASIHVDSVAVVPTPAPHDVVHEVGLSHVHGWVNFHLPGDTKASDLG